ncbi:hypothetical protein H4R35_005007 [Dimargaris xerosporica]|nr:hypothetical protein H4R35_005007 [Dimargaris xerosporica]
MAAVDPAVVHCLTEIVSQDPDRLKAAEAQLQAWETRPQFQSTLWAIFVESSQDVQLRYLAITYIKNSVNRYWRRTSSQGIHPDEKAHLRAQLVDSHAREVLPHILAQQRAELMARVTRIDFPSQWPNVLSHLLHVYQGLVAADAGATAITSVAQLKSQVLLSFHAVLKTLAAMALPMQRIKFQEAAVEALPALAHIYTAWTAEYLQAPPEPNAIVTWLSAHQGALAASRLALKCLRRLTAFGVHECERSPDVKAILHLCYDHLQHFYRLYQETQTDPSESARLVYRHVLLYGKVFLDLHTYHPEILLTTPITLQTLDFYWSVISHYGPKIQQLLVDNQLVHSPERIIIQGLILFKSVIYDPTTVYRVRETDQDGASEAYRSLRERIMSDQFIVQFAEILVNHYLRLSTRDLDEWHTDPETWLINETADHWELSLRPCAEKMYIQLTNKYQHCLLPLIYRALRASIRDQTTPENVLTTDAFYASIGICVHELYDAIDYNEWIMNKLIPETALQGDFGTVLRRRVLWLLDALVDVSLTRGTRKHVYQLLQDMVQPAQHLVVRMTAVATLHTWVDSLEFYPSDFSPHVEAILTGLAHLLQSLSETECRMKAVNLLSLISDRMEHRVAPYANALIGVIGSVWTDATEEHLLCSAILVALAKLVRSMGPMSVDYHELLAGLIHYSTQSDAYGFGYLLEDGLTLWMALLRHTPTMSPSLLALLPDLFRQADRELVLCQDMLRLIRHYLVLDAPLVLRNASTDTYRFIGRLLAECDTEIATHVGNALGVLPQCAPVDLYGPALVASGLFHHTVNAICGNEVSVTAIA